MKIEEVIKKLSDVSTYKIINHHSSQDISMPSIASLKEVVDKLKEVLFPGFVGNSDITQKTMNYYIGSNVDFIYRTLADQIKKGFCFDCNKEEANCDDCIVTSKKIALDFIERLPEVKRLLSTDVIAAFNGDPAAKSYGEVIFCYPSIKVLLHHRIAHELWLLGVPIIPRIISEMSHSETGIDIHPGATIGEYFFIDHGTGVVIGETSVIGNNVRLYQGVTLGAKSFPLDENGKPIKGIARHPIVEDGVIIYSNSTILGRITIGENAVIGGNRWVTEDIPPNLKIS